MPRKVYPSDVSDREWALIEPLIPPAKHGGAPRQVDIREVWNTISYLLSTGCQYSALPNDLVPKSTANHYFKKWQADGTLERINTVLRGKLRRMVGRHEQPSRAIIDAQSVKTTEVGGEKKRLRRG